MAKRLDEVGSFASHRRPIGIKVEPCGRKAPLGHATLGITLDTSSHELPGMQREAADKLDQLLSIGDLNGPTSGPPRSCPFGGCVPRHNAKRHRRCPGPHLLCRSIGSSQPIPTPPPDGTAVR